jgi:hypothetical protein
MIANSLDWSDLETKLRHQTHINISTSNNRLQIYRMIDNIREEISTLSKAEVLARRGNKYAAEDILKKINIDIELVEDFILVAALIG